MDALTFLTIGNLAGKKEKAKAYCEEGRIMEAALEYEDILTDLLFFKDLAGQETIANLSCDIERVLRQLYFQHVGRETGASVEDIMALSGKGREPIVAEYLEMNRNLDKIFLSLMIPKSQKSYRM